MRSVKNISRFFVLLLVTTAMLFVTTAALAGPDDWCLPWRNINTGISIIVGDNDIGQTVDYLDESVTKYTGYHHKLHVTIRDKNNLASYLFLYAPADGFILDNSDTGDQRGIAMQTLYGELLYIQGFESTNQDLEAGDYVSTGDRLGSLNMYYGARLYIEYVVPYESTTLFGINRSYFTLGTDLTTLGQGNVCAK